MNEQSDIEPRIQRVFAEVWRRENRTDPPELQDDTVLLDSGLDSLSFAIFVSDLEEELGYDPFTLSSDAYYPQTFREFVDFYKKYAPAA